MMLSEDDQNMFQAHPPRVCLAKSSGKASLPFVTSLTWPHTKSGTGICVLTPIHTKLTLPVEAKTQLVDGVSLVWMAGFSRAHVFGQICRKTWEYAANLWEDRVNVRAALWASTPVMCDFWLVRQSANWKVCLSVCKTRCAAGPRKWWNSFLHSRVQMFVFWFGVKMLLKRCEVRFENHMVSDQCSNTNDSQVIKATSQPIAKCVWPPSRILFHYFVTSKPGWRDKHKCLLFFFSFFWYFYFFEDFCNIVFNLKSPQQVSPALSLNGYLKLYLVFKLYFASMISITGPSRQGWSMVSTHLNTSSPERRSTRKNVILSAELTQNTPLKKFFQGMKT